MPPDPLGGAICDLYRTSLAMSGSLTPACFISIELLSRLIEIG